MIIKQMLKAEILFNDIVIAPETGTPQGGILSPLLANVVLNELDWWVAKQWEIFKIKEGVSGLEFPKTDAEGNIYTVDRSQKWRKLQTAKQLQRKISENHGSDKEVAGREPSPTNK